MKKMSILASLALCVTIGGVYAAWNYADKNVSTTYAAMGVSVTGVTSQSEKGTLKAEGTNVALQIDDVANTKLHTTEFVYDANGYFTVTFTANANAPIDVLENGIDLKWYIGLATTANLPADYTEVEYEGQDIYTISSQEVQITQLKNREEKGDGTVVFTYQVPMSAVMQKITLTEIVLDTQAAHDAYSQIVNQYLFHFHVAEGLVATNE